MYRVCGFNGVAKYDENLECEIIEGYKNQGIAISKKEINNIKELKDMLKVHKNKLTNIKMELAMLLPSKKRKQRKLTWKQQTKKDQLLSEKELVIDTISNTEESLAMSIEVRNARRTAALTNLESKIGMKGSHQSIVACERILSMLEGNQTVVDHFIILDHVDTIALSYVKIITNLHENKIDEQKEKMLQYPNQLYQTIILPPKGVMEKVGVSLGQLCMTLNVHPSYYELKVFLSQYDKGLTLDDIKNNRCNPTTILPRDVHSKSEMKIEMKCRIKAYTMFREACERMVALVSGKQLSSTLDDGVGEMHQEAVNEMNAIEDLVCDCDWFQKKRRRLSSVRSNVLEKRGKEESLLQYPHTSIFTALNRQYTLMKELVTMEKCASTLQRNYRGHRGYLMFCAMKSIQVIARVTKEYMHEVDPYRDKVKEYVDKIRKKEWNEWMLHSAAE